MYSGGVFEKHILRYDLTIMNYHLTKLVVWSGQKEFSLDQTVISLRAILVKAYQNIVY